MDEIKHLNGLVEKMELKDAVDNYGLDVVLEADIFGNLMVVSGE